MFQYHLFIINNNAYKIYKDNPKYLYEILNTLSKLKGKDLIYGINLFKSNCDIFSVRLLNNYLKERYYIGKNKDYIILKNKNEITKLKIKHSRVIIKSNIKNPNILKIFNIYNKRIFIINFKENTYKWLNELLNKK